MSKIREKRTLSRIKVVTFYGVMTVGALIMLFPFVWMIFKAFQTHAEAIRVPPVWFPSGFYIGNFVEIFGTEPILRYYFNSTIMTSVRVFSVIFISSLAGFVFAKHQAPGLGILFALMLSTLMIPFYVLLIPLYILIGIRLNLADTYLGLILPGVLNSFCLFLMRQHILTIPDELLDQARIDGCSEFRIYREVILPLSKPMLATISIFVFMWSWNDLIWPLVVTSSKEMRPITVAIANFTTQYLDYPNLTMTLATITVVPIIIVFLFMQRYFIEAMTLSGLK